MLSRGLATGLVKLISHREAEQRVAPTLATVAGPAAP
jgi:hypothetical protein